MWFRCLNVIDGAAVVERCVGICCVAGILFYVNLIRCGCCFDLVRDGDGDSMVAEQLQRSCNGEVAYGSSGSW